MRSRKTTHQMNTREEMLMKKKSVLKKSLGLFLTSAICCTSLAITAAPSSAKSPKYYIKINTRKCVATAYIKKGGKWKPIRAMYCAPGKASTPTPLGTWTMKAHWPWYHMSGADYSVEVRYAIQTHGDYFMHSCCYHSRKKSKEYKGNFNGLGSGKTHGCVRFGVMDAKWIYEHCKNGTKVTYYRSKKAGPLGKPQIKIKNKNKITWDPTDPDKKNPNFKMKGAKIKISKKKPTKIKYNAKGKKYRLDYGVTAINPYANQDVTDQLKITKLTLNGKSISAKKFSTKKVGKYKVTYYVRDKYCTQNGKKGNKKTFTFEVVDSTKINVTEKTRTVNEGAKNAVKGVSAKSLSKNLTTQIKTQITDPSGKKKTFNYENAKNYVFNQAGTYKITYTAVNPYPKKNVTATATVKVKAAPKATEQTAAAEKETA